MNRHSERGMAKIALVTGASSGIGRATAETLVAAGYKVFGTSRRVASADGKPFEMLTLEGAQSGLSWMTILRKREGYRRAFADFDANAVAAFDEGDVERLMQDA